MGYPLNLPVGSILYFDTGTDLVTPTWTKLSEHNRSPINLDLNRIEKTQRMSNGTLRKIWIADKKEVSTSWDKLPTYSTLTVDGGMGAGDIKAFYLDKGKGTFKIKISYNAVSARDEIVVASFTSCNFSISKRNVMGGVSKKTGQISAAAHNGSSITYTCNNSFAAGEKVSVTGFESSQFNVTDATISGVTSTTFTVPKQKDLSFSVTEVSASGGIITYIANNTLSAGDRVSITALATAAFNLTDANVLKAEDYYFTVSSSATGTAVSSAAGGTATVIGESTVFAITKTEPSVANKDIKFTSVSHRIHVGENVSISGVRPDAPITNVEAGTTAGQVKYTAANSFVAGDYISISGMTPSEYNVNNAIIISATATEFIIAIAATTKFRKSGAASSILNVKNGLVKSVTADTFTVASLTANGLEITSTASAQQIAVYPASAIGLNSAPQEFWDVSLSLEEV